MRRRPLMWMAVSLACFAGALFFWKLGRDIRERERDTPMGGMTNSIGSTNGSGRIGGKSVQPASTAPTAAGASETNALAAKVAEVKEGRFKYRLSNVPGGGGDDLLRKDEVISLANALIDTSRGSELEIPGNLRAQGDPGTFIVQSRGPIDEVFRRQVLGAGGRLVSSIPYIPNNAYLVRGDEGMAMRLRGMSRVQAVLAYEPYYKITDARLLAAAVEGEVLPDWMQLKVVVFEDELDRTIAGMEERGAVVLDTERSPLGPVLRVRPGTGGVVDLAGLSGVHLIESVKGRVPANDLSRTRVGVAANSIVEDNYLGLTGSGVTVSVNDSGVDSGHPDLTGRVFSDTPEGLSDTNAHGTHVAGIIAGDGSQSMTVELALGSILPPVARQFRGMAEAATIFSVVLDGRADFDLQESGRRTNAVISNNAWNYDTIDYDIAAASYDAAARDALPGVTGSQPVHYVFSAGNLGGDGAFIGAGGEADTILSPGTAKNVITVGAIEQFRLITNEVSVVENNQTNVGTPWLKESDSTNQVAGFSSRGNVGPGLEGEFGRFKPDVVAPGTWVVSTRSAQWDKAAYYDPIEFVTFTIDNAVVNTNSMFRDGYLVDENTQSLQVGVSDQLPPIDMPLYVRRGAFPNFTTFDFIGTNVVNIPGSGGLTLSGTFETWGFGVANPTNVPVRFDLTFVEARTNNVGDFFQVWSNLNESIGGGTPDPFYRYESGTSMAAADVSGVLALMEEFFRKEGQTNSPALMKALLINGARSLGNAYNFQVKSSINYQGWGLINIMNSIPMALSNGLSQPSAPMLMFDQHAENALATGERHTRTIKLSDVARNQSMRVSLVWTDPPGNPAAGVKLVNDLDLIVTNLDTGEAFFGNDILADNDFNLPFDTNGTPNVDFVNNVENVYLNAILGTNYSITVFGRRVNVNAVTENPDNVVQDYALVISSGNGLVEDALTLDPEPAVEPPIAPEVTVMTNSFPADTGVAGQLLLGQHAGANPPILDTNTIPLGTATSWGDAGSNGIIRLGITNQWHFYVIANETNFQHAAFVTFLSTDLAATRMGVTNEDLPQEAFRPQADIDLYVTTDSSLTNLNPAAIAAADKSLGRGGNELIVYSNAANQVYYIGVHSPDHRGAEFALAGLFSEEPFSTTDTNGNVLVRGIPVPRLIPDADFTSAGKIKPGVAYVFGIAIQPISVRRVIVTNTLNHELIGDLTGTLTHDQIFAVLNNHTCESIGGTGICFTNFTYIYEDNGEGNVPGSRSTDGPGSLVDFMGSEGAGMWLLTMVDSALAHTGRVENLWIKLEPQFPDGESTVLDIAPNSFGFVAVDVPPEATNMTVCVENESGTPLPVELYLRRGDLPTRDLFDHFLLINPPVGCLTIDRGTVPPLRPGRYYIGVFNPNGISQRVRITVTFGLDPNGVQPLLFDSAGTPILDDAVSHSSILITNQGRIVRAEVGIATDHPRISDLAFTLISPRGERILLAENRPNLNTSVLVTCGVPLSDGWTEWTVASGGNGHWYKAEVNTNNIDWEQANLIAQASCGYLATITSADENAFVFSLISSPQFFQGFFGNGAGPAIGGIQPPGSPEPGGGWIWQTGEPMIYAAWRLGQPDDNAFGGESRLQYLSGFQGVPSSTWNDFAGNNSNMGGWVMEREVDSQPQYVVFTENTNFARLPIKFAVGSSNASVPAAIDVSTFESAAATTYIAPASVEGWDVVSNRVSVVNDPANAAAGNQFLALGNATISRSIPVTPGRRYTLSYAVRGPGILDWWRGELTALDSAGANDGQLINGPTFTSGVVGNGFNFNGVSYVNVPHSTSLNLSNAFTLEMWYMDRLSPATHYGLIAKRGPGVGPCNFGINHRYDLNRIQLYYGPGFFYEVADYSPLPSLNVFHHHAATFRQIAPGSIELKTYVDGQLVDTEVHPGDFPNMFNTDPVTIGVSSASGEYLNGVMDEVSIYGRFLSDAEIHAIYMRTNRGKFDPAFPSPQGLAQARVTAGGVSDVFHADNNVWQTRAVLFVPTTNSITVEVEGLEPGMLMDSFVLTEMPTLDFVLPEESLQALVGDEAAGLWTLEVWDTRAGGAPTNPTPVLNWQLRLILDDSLQVATELRDRIAVTNTIGCGTQYFYVDAPAWVTEITNVLLFASSPVTVWFNQTNLPTGTNVGDFAIIPNSTGGSFVLTSNSVPMLVPGARYYLGVENLNCASNVTFAIEVDFGIRIIRLTNMVPFINTNSPLRPNDYYVYEVSPNAQRAQFEINFPSGDVTLVARLGPPLPDLGSFDYDSTNPVINDELIVVFTNSVPVPLAPGDWYLTAVNVSTGAVTYVIMASEWPVTGRPFIITNSFINITTNSSGTNTSFCLTWTSLPGVHYYVQGLTDLRSTNWFNLSQTLTAVTNETTFCIDLPSPYHFFRVVEGLALISVPQTPPIIIFGAPTNSFQLQWLGHVNALYQPEWTPGLAPPGWTPFTNIINSTDGVFRFVDDDTQTGGPGDQRFYRIRQVY